MARKCSLYHFETEFEEWKEISISSYKFLWFVQLHEISQRVKCSFSFWSSTAPTSLNAIAHLQVIFTFLVFSSKNLLLEFPVLPAHGALMLGLLSPQPLHDTMDVEAVAALTPHQRAVVSCKFTIRAASIKSHPANATSVVICEPLPDSHSRP